MIVSIVGYAKSGKTTLAVALTRAAAVRGLRVAAIKTGHHAVGQALETDGQRLAAAGARPVIYWGPDRAVRDDAGARLVAAVPLPSRAEFGRVWQDALPAATVAALRSADVLIVEGRIVPGALTVQMRRGGGPDGDRLKYPELCADWTLRGPWDHERVVGEIIDRMEESMPGKPTAKRRSSDRTVRLVVDGKEVKLNGFVKDVFQETVVGIVRALGTEDESAAIELTVSRAGE